MSASEIRLVAFLFVSIFIMALLNKPKKREKKFYQTVLKTSEVNITSAFDIVDLDTSLVPPILYGKVDQLPSLTIVQEKKRFVNIILPAILVAKYRLKEDSLRLSSLAVKRKWDNADSIFYNTVSKRFKSNNIDELLKRLAVHPNSIVLAQAAVESGWGRSRFFKEAYNIFGVWSFNPLEPRIPARVARKDGQVFLRKYDDISESITNYFETIGRTNAYKQFREKRLETQKVNELLPLLRNYSERKEDYILQLLGMIKFNNFEEYDHYKLDSTYIVQEVIPK